METNDSAISDQIKLMKPLGGKNLVLMGSIQNVANYVTQAKADMAMKAFNWFIVTKVIRKFAYERKFLNQRLTLFRIRKTFFAIRV